MVNISFEAIYYLVATVIALCSVTYRIGFAVGKYTKDKNDITKEEK